ncbi:MAG: DUF1501 domain-containing protein, partial [Planctomycetota bacterium]
MSHFCYDHELSRRSFVRHSLASALGLSCSGWFAHLARAAQTASAHRACILLWMSGGPSQTDTFDPKPDHDNGGPVKTIRTKSPGIHISEYLPRIAEEMESLAIIRSMTSSEGDHNRATQLMLTGYRPNPATDYPNVGSLVAKEIGDASNELPNYISLSPLRFGQSSGAGFLGPQYAPMVVTGASSNPRARANLTIENLAPPAGVSPSGLKRRFDLLRLQQE